MKKHLSILMILIIILLAVSCQPRYQIIPIPYPGSDSGKDDSLGTTLGFTNGGSGTVDDPIVISGADEFELFVSLVGSENIAYSSMSFMLNDDVTLDSPIAPIKSYSGVFDGNGKTLRGYHNDGLAVIGEEGDTDNYSALFAVLDGGTVKNLVFEDYTIDYPTDSGFTEKNHHASAIVGLLTGGGHVEDVVLGEGTITSPVRAGGIVSGVEGGTADNRNVIARSYNYADVSTTWMGSSIPNGDGTYGTAGGIASRFSGGAYAVIEDCYNYGDITGFSSGGIVGYSMSGNSEITGSDNHGNIAGTVFAGGIIGSFWYNGAGSISDCHNEEDAVITSAQSYKGAGTGTYGDVNLGGIAGVSGLGGKVTISDCTNAGMLKNENSGIFAAIGGIAGYSTNTAYVGCSSNGTIENAAKEIDSKNTNKWTIGGIVGYTKGLDNSYKNSIGNDTISGKDDGYYSYGQIAGLVIFEDNEEGTTTVEYDSPQKINRSFGYIFASGSATPTIRLSNAEIDSFDFVFGQRKSFIIDLSGNSSIKDLNQHDYMDYGSPANGNLTLKNGEVENIYIFKEAEDGQYPTWGAWTNALTVDGVDSFNWSFPVWGKNSTVNFSINNVNVQAASGSWSIDGGIVNN